MAVDFCSVMEFYKGKRVFVTGHTGFKGTWLMRILKNAGAIVTGYSLEANTVPNLFEISDAEKGITSVIGDIRDFDSLKAAFDEARPEIVLHLAAQPLVIESYKRPVYTYETNVLGTLYLLECVRNSDCVKSFLNVTTDKVYFNDEKGGGFTEDMPLDGYDPYSNSKSCSELVTHSYRSSFLKEMGIPVSTARAGNVIGGGDFSENRIVPDCVAASLKGESIIIRNPYSVRPFQHVLEPLFAYLMIAKAQYENKELADAYNVGPDEADCVSAGELADIFVRLWGDGAKWENKHVGGPHEAGFLRLECKKLKETFSWQPVWNIETALLKTIEWSRAYAAGNDILKVMDQQIAEYTAGKA